MARIEAEVVSVVGNTGDKISALEKDVLEKQGKIDELTTQNIQLKAKVSAAMNILS